MLGLIVGNEAVCVVGQHGFWVHFECNYELAVGVPLQLLERLDFLVIDQCHKIEALFLNETEDKVVRCHVSHVELAGLHRDSLLDVHQWLVCLQ